MFFRGFNVFEKYLQKEEKKFKNIYSSQKQRKKSQIGKKKIIKQKKIIKTKKKNTLFYY